VIEGRLAVHWAEKALPDTEFHSVQDIVDRMLAQIQAVCRAYPSIL
jgi:hypothetical protein